MLCTRQYSFHCPSTLLRPRSVKRVSRLLWRRLPNTGSTVAKRAAIIRLPSIESMRRFIRSVCDSMPSRLPRKKATCRTFVVSGVRRQRVRSAHGTQSRSAPVYFVAA